MPEANSIPFPLNPVGRYPGDAPAAPVKPKLLGRPCEVLHSCHYIPRTKFCNRFFHLTHVDLFKLKTLSPPFLCYPFAEGGLRYSDRSGTSGA
jgi:hypothetical protein